MLAFFLGLLPIVVIFCLSLQYFVFSVTFESEKHPVSLQNLCLVNLFFCNVPSVLRGENAIKKLLSVSRISSIYILSQ